MIGLYEYFEHSTTTHDLDVYFLLGGLGLFNAGEFKIWEKTVDHEQPGIPAKRGGERAWALLASETEIINRSD